MGPRRRCGHAWPIHRATWAISVLAVACHWRQVEAWAPENHERIFRLVSHLLNGKKNDQIKSMLKDNIVDIAGWELEMTKKHPETDVLHWHRQEPEWTCGSVKSDKSASSSGLTHLGDQAGNLKCDQKGSEGSLFCALAYFFEHFAHDAVLKEYPKPKDPVDTPQTLAALRNFKKDELAPSRYLRWLVILLGDLHQPLHWLKEYEYGKTLLVKYQGQQYSLLNFWEEVIPKHLPALATDDKLAKQYESRAPKWWDKVPTELFREWAKESAEVVCSQVYAAMEVTEDGQRRMANPFEVNEELFRRWVDLANDFTVLAGQRTAFILRDILEHKRHKHAAKEGRGRRHHGPRGRRWSATLFTNVVIAGVFVPLLLLLFRLLERSGGVSIMGLCKEHLKL